MEHFKAREGKFIYAGLHFIPKGISRMHRQTSAQGTNVKQLSKSPQL